MNKYLAIIMYRAFIDDAYEGLVDTQVRYFEANDQKDVELMIIADGDQSYQGPEGSCVTWKLDEVIVIEELDELTSGEELIGFIRHEDDFSMQAEDE